MGYNSLTPNITLTAKLTPLGRSRMMSGTGKINSFVLGDSDANYNIPEVLTSGDIPSSAGNIGTNSTISNSTTQTINIKSKLILNSNGISMKPISNNSIDVSSEVVSNGVNIIGSGLLRQDVIDRSSTTDSLVNLYYTFGLPLNATEDFNYTTRLNRQGGFGDTALSGLGVSKILVIGINNSEYGECIDGKTVKIDIPTSAGTYTIYSTFQSGVNTPNKMDALIADTSPQTKNQGDNVAMLFCDAIKKPSGNADMSWATGYGNTKPFSQNNKKSYNFQSLPNLGVVVDESVGVVYLDKGFVVITNQVIVNHFDISTANGTTIEFNSVSTNINQNIICIADRGEFGLSNNRTFNLGDTPRISEVGLYDELDNLIAIAKPDRHVIKNINEFLAIGVKIVV